MMLEKTICPNCGSNDYEEFWLNEEMFECCECGEVFEKRLDECTCGSSSFELLHNGFYICNTCQRIYDEKGNEIHLMCHECGSTMFDFLGETNFYEQCFECMDCGKKYECDDPDLYM